MRLASLALALVLTFGAASALRNPEPRLDAVAFAALNQFPPDNAKAITLYKHALRSDLANPYRWADLGFAFQTAQDLSKARYCYTRALALSGDLPAIWLRDANFHFAMDEPDEALRSAARVLNTVPDYDAVLFGYFDRFGLSSTSILDQIGENPRATRAYARYLLQNRKPDQADVVWRHAMAQGFVDGPLANSYVAGMLGAHRYAEARRDWVQFLDSRAGEYPDRNLLFNGGFETEPTGSDFNWQIKPSEDFDTTRDQSSVHEGGWALHVQFHGMGNVSYDKVIQRAFIAPGRYVLQAWVRTQDITTNECPRIEVVDPESASRLDTLTAGFCGTTGWNPVRLPFGAPAGTNLVAVRVVRHPSEKFNNKISGSLWIDSVRLAAE